MLEFNRCRLRILVGILLLAMLVIFFFQHTPQPNKLSKDTSSFKRKLAIAAQNRNDLPRLDDIYVLQSNQEKAMLSLNFSESLFITEWKTKKPLLVKADIKYDVLEHRFRLLIPHAEVILTPLLAALIPKQKFTAQSQTLLFGKISFDSDRILNRLLLTLPLNTGAALNEIQFADTGKKLRLIFTAPQHQRAEKKLFPVPSAKREAALQQGQQLILNTLLKNSDNPLLLKLLNDRLQQQPKSTSLRSALILYHYLGGNLQQAKKILAVGIAETPHSAIYDQLGYLVLEYGAYSETQSKKDGGFAFLTLEPHDVPCYQYAHLKDPNCRQNDFQWRVFFTIPNSLDEPSYYAEWAAIEKTLGHHKNAISLYRAALTRVPEHQAWKTALAELENTTKAPPAN